MGVSLNPEDFAEGGGLIDDVDCTVDEARFAMFDYQGTVKPGVPSLKLTLTPDDMDQIEQYYSMGNAKDWVPSEDGLSLEAVGNQQQIRVSSNGGIFLKSLIDAGFPVDKLGDDISILDGLRAHFIRVPEPNRPGVNKTAKQKEREEKYGPPTILVVSDVISLPWEKTKPKGAPKKGKAKTKGAPKESPKAEPEADDGLEEKALEAVMEILAEEGAVEKKQLPAKIFQIRKSDPDRNAIVKLVFTDEFLNNGPWEYDGENLIAS